MTKFRLFCVRPAVCVFLWLLLVAPASAQVRLSWNNRIEAPADYNAVVFRGESVVLEAALTQYGIALPLDGTATLYYAVAGTTNYTASAASISGNKLIALWTPALDSGAARYTFFLSANMSGGRIYRANGSITIQASPGPYPPIITQTGPTLVSLQDGISAAGTTNTAQGIAIASLQTGQASLTGQVNAALAMSYAAGDQATLARSAANAAALTASLARATGNYLAATQAVHTATLSTLSTASTNNYRIATNAEAIATAAFNRPSGTDTGTVSRIIGGVLETNKVYSLRGLDNISSLAISNTVLQVGTGDPLTAPFQARFVRDASFSFDVINGSETNSILRAFTNGFSFLLESDSSGSFYSEVIADGHDFLFSLFPGGAGLELSCLDREYNSPVFSEVVIDGMVGDYIALARVATQADYNLPELATTNQVNAAISLVRPRILINGLMYEQYWDTNANTTAWRQL